MFVAELGTHHISSLEILEGVSDNQDIGYAPHRNRIVKKLVCMLLGGTSWLCTAEGASRHCVARAIPERQTLVT